MFNSIHALKSGNKKQNLAYDAINKLGILEDLTEYNPILCGTQPIRIDIENSDLDIIMDVSNFDKFEKQVKALYGNYDGFQLKRIVIRNSPAIKANFRFNGFEFELFGQNQPVNKQYAYLHMVIEKAILEDYPRIRESIIRLKKQGYKTEPAFCKVLGLEGDPYEKLIEFGIAKGHI